MASTVAFLPDRYSELDQAVYGAEFRPGSYLIRVVAGGTGTYPKIDRMDVFVYLERQNAGTQAPDAPLRDNPPEAEIERPLARSDRLTLSLRADGQNLTHEFDRISFAGAIDVETSTTRGLLLRYHYRPQNQQSPGWINQKDYTSRVTLTYPQHAATIAAEPRYGRPCYACSLTGDEAGSNQGAPPAAGQPGSPRPQLRFIEHTEERNGVVVPAALDMLSFRSDACTWLKLLLSYDTFAQNPARPGVATSDPTLTVHSPDGADRNRSVALKQGSGRLLYAESCGAFSGLASFFGGLDGAVLGEVAVAPGQQGVSLLPIDWGHLGAVQAGSPAAELHRHNQKLNPNDLVFEKVVFIL